MSLSGTFLSTCGLLLSLLLQLDSGDEVERDEFYVKFKGL